MTTKLFATKKSEQNVSVTDPWTAIHFSFGLATGLVDVPFGWMLAAAVGYELLERNVYGNESVLRFFHVSEPESPANSVADVVVATIGWYLGRRWNRS